MLFFSCKKIEVKDMMVREIAECAESAIQYFWKLEKYRTKLRMAQT